MAGEAAAVASASPPVSDQFDQRRDLAVVQLVAGAAGAHGDAFEERDAFLARGLRGHRRVEEGLLRGSVGT